MTSFRFNKKPTSSCRATLSSIALRLGFARSKIDNELRPSKSKARPVG
jgi:hypothetical protein